MSALIPCPLLNMRERRLSEKWDLCWEFYDAITPTKNAWGATPTVDRNAVKPQQATLSTLVNHGTDTLLPAHAFNGDASKWGLPIEGAKNTNIVDPDDLTGGNWLPTDVTPTKAATDPAGNANSAWKLVSANGTADIQNDTETDPNNAVVQSGIWARINPAATPADWTMKLVLHRDDDAESFEHECALTKTYAYFAFEDTFTEIEEDSLIFQIVTGDGATTPPDIDVYLPWCNVDSSILQSPVLAGVAADDVYFPLAAGMLPKLSGAQGTMFYEFVPLVPYSDATTYVMLFMGSIKTGEAGSYVALARMAGFIGAVIDNGGGTQTSLGAISADNCGRGNVVRMAVKWDATAMKCFIGGAQIGATLATPDVGSATLPANAAVALRLGAGIVQSSIVRKINISKYVFPDNYLKNITL